MSPSIRIAAMIAAQVHAQRDGLRLAAVGGAVVTVAAVGLLGLSGWFITGAAFAGLAGAAAAQAFNYMMPSAIIRLLAILRTGARYVERVAGHEAALKALARLRPQVFDAVATGPTTQALALSSGDLSSRLVQDVDAVQTLFVRRSAPWSLGAGAVAAVALATLATPLAGAVLLLAMAVACGGCVLIARRLAAPAGREVQIAVGLLKDRLTALEAVAPELKAYGLGGWAVAEADAAAARHDQAQIRLARAGGWMTAWQALATALAVGAVIPATAGAPLPLTALAALAAVMGIEAAAGLASALHQGGSASEAVDRLGAIATDRPPVHQRPVTSARIGFRNADTDLTPPSRIGLFGPSGAGKTTMIERLIGLRDIGPGDARLGGIDAAEISAAERRAPFAYAAQEVRLLDVSVGENLRLAGVHDDATLWGALEDAALAERIRAAGGLGARIGPNGERLSGGERRRLGLARALLRDAPWLVLDEPTEGLDAGTEAEVLAALDRRLAARGQGLILISHRSAPLGLCDRLYRIDGIDEDGRIRMTARTSAEAA